MLDLACAAEENKHWSSSELEHSEWQWGNSVSSRVNRHPCGIHEIEEWMLTRRSQCLTSVCRGWRPIGFYE
jgi:hypothetical protein